MHKGKRLAAGLVGRLHLRRAAVLPVAVIFGVLGCILLIRSFAAVSGVLDIQGEAMNRSGNVSVGSDTAASGGQFVTFRPTTTNTNCSTQEAVSCTAANSDGTLFRETFSYQTTGPQSVHNRNDLLPRWFAQSATQGTMGWAFKSEPVQAQHGHDCGPPPATHHVEEFRDTVFLCRDHIMTTMNPGEGGTAAGLVALKPNHMVDLSKGEAIIDVDVSTESPSAGDWWEIWITPWENQLIAPTDHWYHHAGRPRHSIQLVVSDFPPNNSKHWAPQVYHDYAPQLLNFWDPNGGVAFWNATNIKPLVPVSSTRRDTYRVVMTQNYLKLQLKTPQTNNLFQTVYEGAIPGGFGSNAGVVQFVQSQYEPELGRKIGCAGDPCPVIGAPATWHWDEVVINPAIPYKLIGTEEFQLINHTTGNKVTFREAAPANAELYFNSQSNGNSVQVSFNNGASWVNANYVNGPNGLPDQGITHFGMDFLTYRVNVPQGTTSALIRGNDLPCSRSCGPVIDPYGVWEAQNFHIIAR